MSKQSSTWHSPRLNREIQLVRWGEVGTPVLIFPTAGGDAEECERMHMIDALGDLLAEGLIKAYSVDSIAGRSWLDEDNSTAGGARMQERFDACIYHEVLPAIRLDCNADDIEVIATGASIGAYNALAGATRHPDVFRGAICMSGTYTLQKFLDGPLTDALHAVSPLHFVPELAEDSDQLALLRQRWFTLAHGEGRYEEPAQSWAVANALGNRGIPNRVEPWGEDWHHDWVTWRAMLPTFLREFPLSADTPDANES